MRHFLILLVCFLIPLTSCTRSPFEWDGTKITKYKGEATEVVIPPNATEIGDGAFEDCRSLTSVVIPEGVTSIGDSAFEGCRSLTTVSIPKSVTEIGDSAFEDCRSLISVIIPEGATKLGERVFYRCSSLTSAIVPQSVKEIGDLAFEDCPNLTIYAPEGSKAEEYAQTRKDMRKVKLDQQPHEDEAPSVSVPTSHDSFLWNGKTIIKFIGNETRVVIPEGTTEIDDWAFNGCNTLTSVIIPESVTEIGSWAFMDCSSLTSIVIPEGVTKIGVSAFEGCSSLSSVIIPNSVKEIGAGVFADCTALKQWSISPDNPYFKSDGTCLLTKDGKKLIACLGTAKEYRILEGVTEIEENAFAGCSSLSSVIIPDSVKEIGAGAFADCTALKQWSISPDNPYFKSDGIALLTKDGKKLIACLGIAKEYQIPEGVTEIGESAFYGCSSLTSVFIPDSVKIIGVGAFAKCPALKEWSISQDNSYFKSDGIALLTKDGKTLIACPSVTGKYRIPEGVIEIGDAAFAECKSLTSIVIPEGVKKIGMMCFGYVSLTSVAIPESVTEIGIGAFFNCASLTSVVISKDVTEIEEGAFYGCSSLKSVVFLDGVTKIGLGMFIGCCSLESIVIPNSVEEIEPGAFIFCPALKQWSILPTNPNFKSDGIALLTKDGKKLIACPSASGEYRIPEGVTEIGDGAFAGCCSLKSIIIPGSVEKIGSIVFAMCSALKHWSISPNNPYFKSDGVALLTKDGKTLIACPGAEGEYRIPEGVTEIREGAFFGCGSLTSVAIPEGVTEIGNAMFTGCSSLSSVVIPDSVKIIGDGAFAGCTALKEWSISPDNPYFKSDGIALLTKDGNTLIACPGAEGEYRIPKGVTEIGWYAFDSCSLLTSIVIPGEVTEIGMHIFDGCSSLTSAVFLDGVTKIRAGMFEDCSSLKSVVIPASVEEIEAEAFAKCPDLKQWSVSPTNPNFKSDGIALLTKNGRTLIACPSASGEYRIPEGVTGIGDYAFNACNTLKSVVIPKGIIGIGKGAFYDCKSLTSVTIPKGVAEIGDSAFEDCRSLTSVVIPEGLAEIGEEAFRGCVSLTFVAIPEGVTWIGAGMFEDCSSLKIVFIPASVEEIEAEAFAKCSALKKWFVSTDNPQFKSNGVALLTKDGNTLIACPGAEGEYRIPEGVTEIGEFAFNDCTSLTSIILPKGLMVIGMNAFCDCSSLTSITIPEGLIEIGEGAFINCISIKSFDIPDSVKIIGDGAFAGCTALKEWSISPANQYFKSDGIALLTKDGKKLIACKCSAKEYRFPKGVTEIGDRAFFGCSSLTSIVIPKGVTKIGECTFCDCDSLESVIIPENVKEISSFAFGFLFFLDCPNLTIYAPKGSKAEEYAEENNIPFKAQ